MPVAAQVAIVISGFFLVRWIVTKVHNTKGGDLN